MTRTHFEWDPKKDHENRQKHGVSFVAAQYAFADPRRIIAEDVNHSGNEMRYCCFARSETASSRYALRIGTTSFAYSEPATGGKARQFMSTKIKYTDEPLGEINIIPDFLPSPEELAFREESVKVTISLSKKSIEFFKTEASKHHTQYQRMIRQLLDMYADAQSEQRRRRSTARTKKLRAG